MSALTKDDQWARCQRLCRLQSWLFESYAYLFVLFLIGLLVLCAGFVEVVLLLLIPIAVLGLGAGASHLVSRRLDTVLERLHGRLEAEVSLEELREQTEHRQSLAQALERVQQNKRPLFRALFEGDFEVFCGRHRTTVVNLGVCSWCVLSYDEEGDIEVTLLEHDFLGAHSVPTQELQPAPMQQARLRELLLASSQELEAEPGRYGFAGHQKADMCVYLDTFDEHCNPVHSACVPVELVSLNKHAARDERGALALAPAEGGELSMSGHALVPSAGATLERAPSSAPRRRVLNGKKVRSWTLPLQPAPTMRLVAMLLDLGEEALGRPLIANPPPRVVTGRPLRSDGQLVTAAPIAHLARAPELSLPPSAALSGRWLAVALAEHASIFSFQLVQRTLRAHGAPAELIDRARRAELDEVEHARAAFALASAYGGRSLDAAALSVEALPTPDLDRFAVETFEDGCVAETFAAEEAEAALLRCEVPEVRRALARVAVQEQAHAELAWDILAWALPSISKEAVAQIEAFEPQISFSLDPGAPSQGWISGPARARLCLRAWRALCARRSALL